jgi:dihydroceramidase
VVAAAGLLIFSLRGRRFIHDDLRLSVAYIVILALVGLTSFYNHATLSLWGGTTDFSSMFALILLVILLGFGRFLVLPTKKLIGMLIVLTVPFVYLAGLPQADFIFAGLVLLGIGVHLLLQIDKKNVGGAIWFWLGVTTFLVAYGVWLLDVWRVWCQPTSLIQGHAVWHVLAAAAAVLLYQYFLPKNEVVDSGPLTTAQPSDS